MLSQRILQHSARHLVTKSLFTNSKSIPLATSLLQIRTAAVNSSKAQQLSNNAGDEILVAQRLHRPVAPHLTIYRPQITWYLSMLHRLTGIALSGGLYLFAMSYAAAPLLGWNLSSAAMAASIAKWPAGLKLATKITIAVPFTFKCLNGMRHLVWDTGAAMKNQQVIVTGWTVVGLTFASALGLALFV